MQAVVDEEPEPPRSAGALEPVITALLRKDPAERPDAAHVEQMLAEAAEGRRPRAAQEYVATQHVDLNGAGDTTTHVTRPRQARDAETAAGTLHQPPAPPAPRPRGRRRGRTAALVLALAAVVGAAGAVAVTYLGGLDSGTRASATTSSAPPTASPANHAQNESTVPDGWVRKKDPAGFSLALPGKEWKRQRFDSFQTDYTPDGGRHFIRIAIDSSPDFDSAYLHQIDLEQQLQRLVDYKRVVLRQNIYRDRQGSEWEYTWTALAKDTPFPGPRHAIEETYFARDGVEYAIYMSGPQKDWKKTREQFETVLRSWRPPTG
jgi:hypothetical protein